MDRTVTTIVITTITSVASAFVTDNMWLPTLGVCVLFVTFVYGASLYIKEQKTKTPSAGRGGNASGQESAPGIGSITSLIEAMQKIGDDAVARAMDMETPSKTAQQRQAQPSSVPTKQQQAQGASKSVPMTPLQAEAREINELLRYRLKIPAVINWMSQKAIIQTPRHTLYRLDEKEPVNVPQIERNADAIGRHIRAKNRSGKGNPVTVRVMDTQPLYLQVSRVDPRRHAWESRKWERSPMVTCLGDYWNGPQRTPAMIDMFGKGTDAANGLFCGQPRSGKTTLLRAALLGLMESTKPTQLQVYSIDTKMNAMSIFDGIGHMRIATGDFADVTPILDQFVEWCTPQSRPTDGVYRLLVIDEFHDLLVGANAVDGAYAKVFNIMSKGGEAGIRVWIATQIPDKDTYPPGLKALTHFKVACRVENDGYLKNPLGVYSASSVVSKAECVFVGGGISRIVTNYHIPDDVLDAEVDAMKARFGGGVNGDVSRGKIGVNSDVNRGKNGVNPNLPQGKIGVKSGVNSDLPQGKPADTRVMGRSLPKDPVEFPVKNPRMITDTEAIAIYELHLQGVSGNEIQRTAFKSAGGHQRKYMKAAIERAKEILGVEDEA